MSSSKQPPDKSPSVAWPDVVKFVRQLSHDIRNNLNAVELQSAYLAELAKEGEMKGEIQRLREMTSQIGTSLQRVTAGLNQANPNPIPYPATDFVEDLKQKLTKEFPDNAAKVTWDVQLKDATLQIDPQLAQQAFLELFGNAFQHEPNVKAGISELNTIKKHRRLSPRCDCHPPVRKNLERDERKSAHSDYR